MLAQQVRRGASVFSENSSLGVTPRQETIPICIPAGTALCAHFPRATVECGKCWRCERGKALCSHLDGHIHSVRAKGNGFLQPHTHSATKHCVISGSLLHSKTSLCDQHIDIIMYVDVMIRRCVIDRGS